jgi:predicted TIM-barrel fold metal-dependent hydrolase
MTNGMDKNDDSAAREFPGIRPAIFNFVSVAIRSRQENKTEERRGLARGIEWSDRSAAAAVKLDAAVAMLKDTRWHTQFYARLPVLVALKDRLAAMPMPAVFDHFAGAKAALGVNQPGFDAVLDPVRSGKAHVKISGAYRASDQAPDYADVAPLARALIAANADRVVWGSDWPHLGPPAKLPAEIN